MRLGPCLGALACAGQGECLVRPDADPAGPQRTPGGAIVGTCSEFVKTFGCWRRIPRGGLTELPPKICVD